MNLEKFLYKKLSLWILLLTIILSFIMTILFGSLVLRSTTAKNIALIPVHLGKIFSKVENDFVVGDNKFGKQDKFVKFSTKPEDLSGYLLLSRYDYKKKRSIVEILIIKNGKILHTWAPDINKINNFSKLPKQHLNLKRDHNLARYRILHPILLENGDLIIKSMISPIVRISACSKMKWFVDKAFHHSIEFDFDGNIWVPGVNFPPTIKGINIDLSRRDGRIFTEDTIESLSQEGKILFSKPLLQIFIDNKIEHLLPTGWRLAHSESNLDLLHLNDVQPVFYDSKYWKKNDVFVSLSALSLVLLYRPSTNKVIWYKRGPWVLQHDVDVINDHQIAIFNNNLDSFLKVDGYNETLIYDFDKDEIFSPYRAGYKKNNIRTIREGLSEILENGDIFVEDTSNGRILRMDKMGNVKWQFTNIEENGKIYLVNWSRFLNESSYSKIIEKISNIKCNEK